MTPGSVQAHESPKKEKTPRFTVLVKNILSLGYYLSDREEYCETRLTPNQVSHYHLVENVLEICPYLYLNLNSFENKIEEFLL